MNLKLVEESGSPEQLEIRHHQISTFVRKYGIVLVFLVLFIVLSVSSDAFLTSRNLLNLLSQNAPIGIVACGATIVIIAGGFDLSIGAVYAFSGVVAAYVAINVDPTLGWFAGIALGLVLGLLNGVIITRFQINSFIATLATGFIYRGIATVITGGFLVSVSNDRFKYIGNERVIGLPIPAIIFIVVAVLTGIALARTKYGRYVYAAGGNAEAARLSGVRVNLVQLGAFGFSGACAGLAGVIAASRVSTGQANTGVGIELAVIAAVVVGGISIKGGEGTIWRAVIGVLLIALISNGFNMLNIDPFYQAIALGTIILVAVGVDNRSRVGRSG
jgi:ribose transport system permease protein